MKRPPARSSLFWLLMSVGLLVCFTLLVQPRRSDLVTSEVNSVPIPSAAVTNPALASGSIATSPLSPAVVPEVALPWKVETTQRQFVAFAQWTDRFLAAAAHERASLESEGVKLAQGRRAEMVDLIQAQPEQALKLGVPVRVAALLPGSVRDLLEERISSRGDLEVYGVLAEPGNEHVTPPVFRRVQVAHREFNAFVYGRRLGQPTLRGIALNGIVLDGLMAVNESPLRRLHPAEVAQLQKATASEVFCAVSGQNVASSADVQGAEVAGVVTLLCGDVHANDWEQRLTAVEADGPSGSGGGNPEASGYTEGVKRLLIIRVEFPDLLGEPFSQARGDALVSELNDFYAEMSYGRASFKLTGAGSAVTPVLLMPQTADYYGNNNYFNELRNSARAAAMAAGFVLSQYDFDLICMGRVPGFTWSGLGYVGAPGAWIRNNSSAGVAAHELGHNYGLNHANFWDTGGVSMTGSGTSVEYGDSYDTMGSATAGPRHFNARYKNYLNWITSAEKATVTASGTYRIYAHDYPNAVGFRGLKITKDAARNYWVEFRQQFTGNNWMMNGVTVRWAGNGNERSDLLDYTPGSTEGKNDAAVVLGRTFSDRASGIHITPVAKVGTVPESVNVVVNMGTFPGNRPPGLTLQAVTTTGSPGATLAFNATASDPDSDVLACFWDFGDGDFGTNGVAASHVWPAAGEYVVQCTVSDMKGGRATKSLVVRIGNPSTFRISGRASANGQPLEAVRISAPGARGTFTDSDGSYNLVGLLSGSYVVAANLEGYIFIRAGFQNPVVVGPNAVARDFVGGAPGSQDTIPLIAGRSVWQFLDDGSNQETNWSALAFDDHQWSSGAGEFGYGDGDEITLINFGTNANNKYITTYFRQRFMIDDRRDFSLLNLGLLRDDGVVVYLNGHEVFRNNMPAGVITSGTPAVNAIAGTDESTFIQATVDSSYLLTGTNVLAVEVHQVNGSSSDLSFDLTLSGRVASNNFIASGAIWRFLEDGSSPATNWTALDYVDSAWPSGASQLGYGDGDEATLINYGPDANNKFITSYFRRMFTVPAGVHVGSATLGLLRDDGAVVYINGQEIYRSNMPPGPVDSATRATTAVGGVDETTFYETSVDPSLFLSGLNVIAVEVHQNSPSSSDFSFDLYLNTLSALNTSRSVYLTAPVNGAEFVLGSNIVFMAEASAGYGRQIDRVEFYAGADLVGEDATEPYSCTWSNAPLGLTEVIAVAVDTGGNILNSLPVEISVIYPRIFTSLLARGSVWRFLDNGTNLGTSWVGRDFADQAWSSGPARLGYGGDGEVTTVDSGPAAAKYITTYFRRTFDVPNVNVASNLLLQLARDDGAVIYLNGLEIFRSNMPGGPVLFSTLAASAVSAPEEQTYFEATIPGTHIVSGTNVLAVEVHQSGPASSDLGFDLELVGIASAGDLPPTLGWERSNGALKFYWSAATPGWSLYWRADCGTGSSWSIVQGLIANTNQQKYLLIVPTGENRYYQLRQP